MHIICSSDSKLGPCTIQIWSITHSSGKRKMIGKSLSLVPGNEDHPEKFSEFEVDWNQNWDMSIRSPELSLTKQVSLESKTKSVLINIVDGNLGPQLEVHQNTKELVRG